MTQSTRIVVSHYNSLEFRCISGDMWVYNKSGKSVSGVKDIPIKNEGREGLVYLRHIIENYDRLAPTTVFVQDDFLQHQPSVEGFYEQIQTNEGFHQFPCTWRADDPNGIHKREVVNGKVDCSTITNPNAIAEFCQRFDIRLPERYTTETCSFFLASDKVLRSVSKEKYEAIYQWLKDDINNEFVFEHCYKLLFMKEFKPHYLIRTYEKDRDWLMYCLASIRKWEPDISITAVAPVGHDVGCPVIHVEPHHPEGYIDQQYTKLNADLYVPSTATHVIHMDSDCMMIGRLSGMMVDGKPMMLKTPYSQLDDQAKIWQSVTANYMGFNPDYEYMRRMPLVYPIGIYKRVRDYLSERNGPMEDWFPNIEGRKLSEFNILGAYADKFMADEFHWIDTSKEELPPLVARQGWSWGGLDAVRAEWKELMSK
jgi:hypothetical protein